MFKLKIFLAALLAAMALGGCNRSKSGENDPVTRDIEGQAFIVTERRNNVKLGLLDVYVADQQAVSNLLNDLKGHEGSKGFKPYFSIRLYRMFHHFKYYMWISAQTGIRVGSNGSHAVNLTI